MFFDQGKDLGFENNTSTDSRTWGPGPLLRFVDIIMSINQ